MVGDSYRLLARALGMGPQGWLSSIREREERRVMQGSFISSPGCSEANVKAAVM